MAMITPARRDKFLAETEWLAGRLGTPDLGVIDASWYLAASGGIERNGRDEYRQAHIPGAVFFDIDALADRTTDLPHMLATPQAFARAAGRLGLSDEMELVVYDGAGLFSAARVWWMFKVMGARRCRVLNGGMPKWRAQGRALESGEPKPAPRIFTCRAMPGRVHSMQAVRRHADTGDAVIVDARAPGRFAGQDREPRPGLASGHIPGSKNVPYDTLLNDDGTMREVNELAEIFARAGVDIGRPVVTTCGSGVTAAIVSLALELLGATDVALYDGSWAQWGADSANPIATR